jgi:bifunctional UDP-N-acetylglucosamine pyrophosphorylase/glucosamine-1-phosphate N-acetyltransferase
MKAPRACVLAAGKGTRMGGDRPKVLFEAGGKPLIEWCLKALSAADVRDVVAVVGFRKDEVVSALPTGVRWVEQSPQLGTGHAVMCARVAFQGNDAPVLVTCGDMPLLSTGSFRKIAELRERENAACALLTVRIPPDSRFGRIVRDGAGNVLRIVEYKDATEEERAIDQGNTGVMCFRADDLWDALDLVKNENAQGEYYLTDVIGILIASGKKVVAHVCENPDEALGVNTPEDLAQVEKSLREKNG